MNILMVYPEFPDTFWGFKHAVKFVGRKAANPPLGLVTIASMLPGNWTKKIVDLNIQKLKQSDLIWADFVFISAMDVQRDSARKLIHQCKMVNKPVVAGGPLFTQEYDHFEEVDHFILNEGEITLPLFIKDLEEGHPQRLYITDDYADIRETPLPQWELIDIKQYDSMSIQFSRGCPFNCEFCNVTALLGHRPRTKTKEQIIAELDQLYQLGWRRNIFFVDDNFIGNKKILKQEILPALIEWRKGKKGCLFITEASINLADDPELIEMMVESGFMNVFVGIETPDEDSLAECHKTQNKNRDLVESVKILQRAGLQVMGGFIVGFDNDSPTIFQRQVEFIQKSGIVTAMVGLLQAPLGTILYQRMQEEGRLLRIMSGDNTDGTTNIIPKMEADLLKEGYLGILRQIYSPQLFYQRVKTFLSEYKPRRATVTLHADEIMAFLRSIILLGFFGRERKQYWDLFFWTLVHYPEKFPLAITMSIYGYHFRRVSELHIFEKKLVEKGNIVSIRKKKLISEQA
jgi:radical SAM superfamily enzyme YgiQ (UPF0313 family)